MVDFLDYTYSLKPQLRGSRTVFLATCLESSMVQIEDEQPHVALREAMQAVRECYASKPALKPKRKPDDARLKISNLLTQCLTELSSRTSLPGSPVCTVRWVKGTQGEFNAYLGHEPNVRKCTLHLEQDWVAQLDEFLDRFPQKDSPAADTGAGSEGMDSCASGENRPTGVTSSTEERGPTLGTLLHELMGTPASLGEAVQGVVGNLTDKERSILQQRLAKQGYSITGRLTGTKEGSLADLKTQPSPAVRLGTALHEVLEASLYEGKTVGEVMESPARQVLEADYRGIELSTLAQSVIRHLTKTEREKIAAGERIDLQPILYRLGLNAMAPAPAPAPEGEPWELRPRITELALDVVRGHRPEADTVLVVRDVIRGFSPVDQATLTNFFQRELRRFRESKELLREGRQEEGDGRR